MQKKLLRLSLILVLIMCFPVFLKAQSRELGIMLGAMGYKGDLNPTMYSTKSLNLGIGILYRRSYSNHWAFKAAVNYGHVSADDANADDAFSRNRNLMFKSHILEGTAQFEFNFLPYQTANPNTKFTPYVLGGLSVFHFNPKAEFEGEWINLQPLGTEGQGTPAGTGKRYKRTSAALTFGGGFKFKISRRFGLTIESAVRRTYTDYLDDVSTVYADPLIIRRENGRAAGALSDRSIDSAPGGDIGRQRGDKAKRDWYVFTGVQLTYTLSKRYIDSCQPFKIKLW